MNLDLTEQEQENVRTALKFLRVRCGGWAALCKVLGIKSIPKVAQGRDAVTARLVFRVARFAHVGVDELLAGQYPSEGACPHCGAPRREQADD